MLQIVLQILSDVIKALLWGSIISDVTWQGIRIIGVLLIALAVVWIIQTHFGMDVLPGLETNDNGNLLSGALALGGLFLYLVGKYGEGWKKKRLMP